MANIKMGLYEIGQQYTDVQLANVWEYKSHHPLVLCMGKTCGPIHRTLYRKVKKRKIVSRVTSKISEICREARDI